MADTDIEQSSNASPLEDQPLLLAPSPSSWRPPRGFIWIQVATMSNVFLYGFDGTITASTYGVISSEFDAANTASWLTTSYLVTSTAFQPLYGRVSDIFGRRICFFISTITFALGCLGCAMAGDVVLLNCMRALTGFGGGGLMTMATIVNSDMIPFRRRGMYQAMQNGMFGFGAICGASFGGTIADGIGWRWCFALQVPISALALVVGALVIRNPQGIIASGQGIKAVWAKVDFTGAMILVVAISVQLVGLSLGGNELPWSSPWVIGSLVGSTALFGAFWVVETRTKAIPVIPLRMLKGRLPVSVQVANVCAGMSAYAVSDHPRVTARPNGDHELIRAVSIHAPAILPSGPTRLGHESRSTTRHSVPSHTYWRADRWHRDVSLGKAHLSCPHRSRPDGRWKSSSHVLELRGFQLEVFRLHLPGEPRAGYRVPRYLVHFARHL